MNKTLLSLALLCLVFCGCASPRTFVQEGVLPDRSNAAKIICQSERTHKILNGMNQKLFISSINGKSTFTMTGALTDTAPFAEIAYVLPGRQYLDLQFSYMNSIGRGTVWFDAEAGGSYVVRRQISGYSIVFWMEDVDTGKVIGGIPGGEPPSTNEPARPSDPAPRPPARL